MNDVSFICHCYPPQFLIIKINSLGHLIEKSESKSETKHTLCNV